MSSTSWSARCARLSPNQRRALAARLRSESLTAFVPRITPAFAPPGHLAPLLAAVERVERAPVRACVAVPPRHAKTETLLHAIARLLLRHPDWTIGYVSYAADIARSKSRLVRDYAARAGVQLREDSTALHEWRTPEGGGLLATGVGGPLTGQGVRVLIVDDPFKNRQDADSPTVRAAVHAWFTSTGLTRVEPGGSVLVVHTRWHPDDLIGRLARDKEVAWELIELPAIDPRRGGDGSLWPERWPAGALAVRRAEVGEHDWQSLFQQHPVARKGRVFPTFARATHVVPAGEIAARYHRNGRWLFRRCAVGVDFGVRHPGTAIVVGETGAGDWLVVHEEVHEGRLVAEWTDEAHGVEGWLRIYARLASEFRPEVFAADPSEPGNVALMRTTLDAWDDLVVVPADNRMSDGINTVNAALAPRPAARPRLLVSDACPRLIAELETWSYRVVGGVASEVPHHLGDDAADGLRYACRYLEGAAR